jgi:hypothetical protein
VIYAPLRRGKERGGVKRIKEITLYENIFYLVLSLINRERLYTA